MEAHDNRPTPLERKIQDAHKNHIVDIEGDATLRSLMRLLRYVLAQHATELHGLPLHEICNEKGIQEQFEAFIGGLTNVWGQPPAWEEKPLVWEKWLVHVLVEKIKRQLPKMYKDFGEGLPHILRLAACAQLGATTNSDAYRTALRDYICQSVLFSFDGIPGNPIRIDYAPSTGQLDGRDFQTATVRQLMEFKSLQRIFEPRKQSGRPKGSLKPASSGRKSSVGRDVYIEAWEAKQGAKKYQSIPWWRTFAHKKNIPIPADPKGQGAFRKKLEEWALKGKSLSQKK